MGLNPGPCVSTLLLGFISSPDLFAPFGTWWALGKKLVNDGMNEYMDEVSEQLRIATWNEPRASCWTDRLSSCLMEVGPARVTISQVGKLKLVKVRGSVSSEPDWAKVPSSSVCKCLVILSHCQGVAGL